MTFTSEVRFGGIRRRLRNESERRRELEMVGGDNRARNKYQEIRIKSRLIPDAQRKTHSERHHSQTIRVEGGEWRVEGGGWRVEGGGWRVEDGGWRVEGETALSYHTFLLLICHSLDKMELSTLGSDGQLEYVNVFIFISSRSLYYQC